MPTFTLHPRGEDKVEERLREHTLTIDGQSASMASHNADVSFLAALNPEVGHAEAEAVLRACGGNMQIAANCLVAGEKEVEQLLLQTTMPMDLPRRTGHHVTRAPGIPNNCTTTAALNTTTLQAHQVTEGSFLNRSHVTFCCV